MLLIIVWCVVIYVGESESHLTEILLEEDEMSDVVGIHSAEPSPPVVVAENTCHVEFTVVRRAVGHCVKLGKVMRACISGTYIHPFHQECL